MKIASGGEEYLGGGGGVAAKWRLSVWGGGTAAEVEEPYSKCEDMKIQT